VVNAYVCHSRYGRRRELAVKVDPRAKKAAITGERGDGIKVSITALLSMAKQTKPASSYLQSF